MTKKKKKKKLLLHSKFRSLGTQPQSHPQGPQPSREVSGQVWGPTDHGQGSRRELWEPNTLTEQISGTWAKAQLSESDEESGGSRQQLSPSHEADDIK